MMVKQGPSDRKRKKKRNTKWQRSQVKGKKSICLQTSTEQCFPRSGNWGVPILIQLPPAESNCKNIVLVSIGIRLEEELKFGFFLGYPRFDARSRSENLPNSAYSESGIERKTKKSSKLRLVFFFQVKKESRSRNVKQICFFGPPKPSRPPHMIS